MANKTKEELQGELEAARKARRDLEHEVRSAEHEALNAVRKQFSERVTQANVRVATAEKFLREHLDATASHPWKGKTVKRILSGTRDVVLGIVEVRRTDTEFPANRRYGIPAHGKAFVRVLKKDGTPGKSVDQYHPDAKYGWGEKAGQPIWSLVE